MNESLVSVVLTLALESLFPKPPVKTKKVALNTAAEETSLFRAVAVVTGLGCPG